MPPYWRPATSRPRSPLHRQGAVRRGVAARGLSRRDRSLITVAALVATGKAEQLTFHLHYARQNGLTETEPKEAITHLAFYTGWPNGMSAMAVAMQVFA